ncbi:MAG: ShlB/FhaC/HecB family hemolysin secretion/activation protein [Alphaproteobacteria bacterium]|nr:ShlB/FhaC/HecB family hemolysin secretion/activation protein [Alphaproteobacteria bacterium]
MLKRTGVRFGRLAVSGSGATLGALALALALSISTSVDAQVVPGAIPPARDRPLPPVPSQPDFDFSIVAPHRSPVPRAVDEVHFKLSGIRITGATTIPPDTFKPLWADKIGKDITLADILSIADQIEAAYRARGFLLVRAYVPPQRVANGMFTINVSEGFLANVTVQGGDDDVRDHIRDYLQPAAAARPLTSETIERGLLLTNDLPGISAAGVLKPSPDTPGASDLVVDVSQPWITGGAAVDNRGSRFSGIWTFAGDVEFNSLFGGDQLGLSVTGSPSSALEVAGSLRYRHPIGDDGLIGSIIGSITHGQPGSTLTAFNVQTDSWAAGPRLTYPVIRTRDETLLLDGGFTVQDARVYVLGSGVSHDKWRVLDVGGTYQLNDIALLNNGSWSTTFDVAQGIPGLGGTDNHSPHASRVGALLDFTKATAFTRLSIPLKGSFGVVLSGQGQYSFAPLITGEQIAFGGTQIGRGYDPGAITGDHGLGGAAELRYDYRVNEEWLSSIEPYLYVDGAQTWYIQRGPAHSPSLLDQNIVSLGGGVRFWLPYNITGALEAAHTTHAVLGSDAGKQATKLLLDLAIRF